MGTGSTGIEIGGSGEQHSSRPAGFDPNFWTPVGPLEQRAHNPRWCLSNFGCAAISEVGPSCTTCPLLMI